MLPAQPSPWREPRILFVLLMVFVAGSAAGALTMRYGIHSRLHRASALFPNQPNMSFDQMKSDLNLTPDQAERLKSILDDMVKYKVDMEAEIESFRATGRERIVQMLTPEQRKQFERLSDNLAGR